MVFKRSIRAVSDFATRSASSSTVIDDPSADELQRFRKRGFCRVDELVRVVVTRGAIDRDAIEEIAFKVGVLGREGDWVCILRHSSAL